MESLWSILNVRKGAAMISATDSLQDACRIYLKLNTRITDPQTAFQYALALTNLEDFFGRPMLVSDLCDDAVALMMRGLIERGLACRTVNDRRARIHALWSWLCRRGVLQQWPTTQRMVEPQRTPDAWTERQIRQLFCAASLQRRKIGGVPSWLWWTCLLSLAWDTGERIGALMQVTWDNLDMDGRWLSIPAEKRKGKRADKCYRLSPETIAHLRMLARHGKPLILPWDRHPNYLWYAFGKLLKDAGLPQDRRSKFHRIRRSVATHFQIAGGDAQAALGHSSAEVTAKYIDTRLVPRVHPSDILFRPDGPRPAA